MRRPTVEAHLARHTVEPDGCWLWSGSLAGGRYGKFQFEGRTVAAHVAAWAVANGRWPVDGEVVRHTCDRPACINPHHLTIGSHLDNMRDRNDRGRLARGERQGSSKLTVAKVVEIRQRYADGEGCIQLGAAFNVHFSTINRVVNRDTWRHVA